MVFKTFLQRVDERVRTVEELLASRTISLSMRRWWSTRTRRPTRGTPAEARENWRKRIKYDLLVLKADKTEGKEAIEKLKRRYQSVAQADGTRPTARNCWKMYLTSITSSLDPHTSYMSPTTLENFRHRHVAEAGRDRRGPASRSTATRSSTS